MAGKVEIVDRQELLDYIEEFENKIVILKNVLAALDVIERYNDDEHGEKFGG